MIVEALHYSDDKLSIRNKIVLPRICCWGSHFWIFTFGGWPGKMSDSHFHRIFCGNSE